MLDLKRRADLEKLIDEGLAKSLPSITKPPPRLIRTTTVGRNWSRT